MIKTPSLIQLDWKDFSEEAKKQFKKSLERYNLHFGDAEQEYYGEAVSDTYMLYVFHRKLTKEELEKYFKFEDDSEEKECLNQPKKKSKIKLQKKFTK